jgi:hypothetical protein
VDSGWVETELGAVESVKVTRSGDVIIVCVSAAPLQTNRDKRCELFCFQEKVAIERSDYWGSGKCES